MKRRKRRGKKRTIKKMKKYTPKYKSCKHTPCGSAFETHNNCKPSYCVARSGSGRKKWPGAKNWAHCNMKNWHSKGTRKYFYYKSKCVTVKNIKRNRKKKNRRDTSGCFNIT